jgi:hypothetical protein
VQDWSNNIISFFRNSSQALQARSTSQVEEDCFCVVIGCVGGRYEGALQLAGGLIEKSVTGGSPCLLHTHAEFPRHPWHIGSTTHKRNANFFAECFAKFEFLIGFRSHSVMQMSRNYV